MRLTVTTIIATSILALTACGSGDEPSGLVCTALYRAAQNGQVLTVEQRTELVATECS